MKRSTRPASRGKTVTFDIYEALFTRRAVESFLTKVSSEGSDWKDPLFTEEKIAEVLANVVEKIDNLSYFATPVSSNGVTSEVSDSNEVSPSMGSEVGVDLGTEHHA